MSFQVFDEAEGHCTLRDGTPHNTVRVYDESENCNVYIPDCNKPGNFYFIRYLYFMQTNLFQAYFPFLRIVRSTTTARSTDMDINNSSIVVRTTLCIIQSYIGVPQ